MSDKPLVQQRLAQQLADLVLVTPQDRSSRAQNGLRFLEAFWDTQLGEWAGLDKHRIDKFYLLVRRFVQVGFRLLAEEKWEPQAVSQFTRMFRKAGGSLNTNDPNVPDSLTYHLADVYLVELERALELVSETQQVQGSDEDAELEDEESDLPLVPTVALLQPFIDTLATAKSKQMYQRIWSTVFEPLLDDTLLAAGRVEDSDDDEDVMDDVVDQGEDEEEADLGDEGDETSNTIFHSFADESTVEQDDAEDDEDDISDSSAESTSEEDGEDVQFPLLLALSSVPMPSTADEDDLDDGMQLDVALLLRAAIFQSLFVAASQKDATEARRRNLYELWRNEQDRLNDTKPSDQPGLASTQNGVHNNKDDAGESDEDADDA